MSEYECKNPAPEMERELDRQDWARTEGHAQELGEFLEWLQSERGLVLCDGSRPMAGGLGYETARPGEVVTQKLLAEYFGIDLQKVESERQEILRQLQEGG